MGGIPMSVITRPVATASSVIRMGEGLTGWTTGRAMGLGDGLCNGAGWRAVRRGWVAMAAA